MSTKKQNQQAAKATPKLSTSNSEIEHDAICAQATRVVKMWESGEATIRNADAMAVFVIIRAHAFGFFGDDINCANWHKVETKDNRTALLDTMLTDLFGMEKPTAADRQRLQRIRLVVPALIKAGGLDIVSLSQSNVLMVSTECGLFKACNVKAEVEGKMGLSIAQLDKGARKYLQAELPKDKRSAKKTADKFKGMTNSVIIKELENRLAKTTVDKLSKTDQQNAKHLLVQLLGLFGATDDGSQLDQDKISDLYKENAA